MADAPTNPALQFVRGVAAHDPGDEADERLLARFVDRADEGAFHVLLRRHGPLVLSVCTRVLGTEPDAADAFQATFLVLVRKAGSLRAPGSLAPWLYGVAYRTALKAKAELVRRRVREERLADRVAPPAPDDLMWRDVRLVLDEEVNRLPHRYRAPLVLCYFEGRTNEQAARLLGCPPGTVFSRLAEARRRLRRRLGRRGLALSAGVLAAVLSGSTAPAAVPAPAVVVTSQAARAFAAGPVAAAGTTPARAAALAEGVLRAMVLTKLKVLVAALVAIGVVGLAVGVLGRHALAEGPPGAGAGAALPAPVADPSKPEQKEKPKSDKDKLQGKWVPESVEERGKKISEEEIKEKNFVMVFEGDKVTLPMKDGAKEVEYTLAPTKKPKEIDLAVEGKTPKGIYELEGDTLKLCFNTDPDGDRPTKFATTDTNNVLMVLKRKK
jgi:RNA polymerase sigma factor (sigma-70 family)